MATQKGGADAGLVAGNALLPYSYGVMVLAGSLVGFGALVSLGPPQGGGHAAEVVAVVHESHATPEAPAPEHGASHHEGEHGASHHEGEHGASHHEEGHGASHHEEERHEALAAAEAAQAQVRDLFTEKFMSKFLSTNCAKNPHSETGVQLGVNSYTEFTNSKRSRYVEGGYRFESEGFKLIIDEDSYLEFKMTGDVMAMTSVMVAGVAVTAPPDRAWKICASDPHEPPLEAPKPTVYEPSDGLRLALAAGDREAVTHYLALGAYVPTDEFGAVMKAANLEGPIGEPIRIASKQNEDNTLRRKAIAAQMEARRKAEEAKHPQAAKPKVEAKEKPKTGH